MYAKERSSATSPESGLHNQGLGHRDGPTLAGGACSIWMYLYMPIA